jgi:hypothetical protein
MKLEQVRLFHPADLYVVGLKAVNLAKCICGSARKSGFQTEDIRKLVIEGEMADVDFEFIRRDMSLLQSIDISAVSLPSQTLCNNAFASMSASMSNLTDIKLPANVKPDILIVELEAGDLGKRIWESARKSGFQTEDIRKLVIEGGMADVDFEFIRRHMVLKSIDISLVSLPSQTLCNGAFSYMKELADVKLPANLKVLDCWVFSCCGGLRSVELPDALKVIGARAFMDCSLSSIKLPDTVEVIESGAFGGCKKLTLESLPAGLRDLGQGAFAHCKKLSLRFIPDNCVICPDAFDGCDATTLATYNKWLQASTLQAPTFFARIRKSVRAAFRKE